MKIAPQLVFNNLQLQFNDIRLLIKNYMLFLTFYLNILMLDHHDKMAYDFFFLEIYDTIFSINLFVLYLSKKKKKIFSLDITSKCPRQQKGW